jgi:hypothetical protein
MTRIRCYTTSWDLTPCAKAALLIVTATPAMRSVTMSVPPEERGGVDKMGLRFRRSVRIAPGVKVNLTKTGLGLTVGPRGSHYSVHSSGRRTRTVGLPGTGLYYQSVSRAGGSAPTRQRVGGQAAQSSPVDVASVVPKPGFFASGTEKAYHAGGVAYLEGNLGASAASFEQALAGDPSITSAHLFAGIAAIGLEDSNRAIGHLEAVVRGSRGLPDAYQAKYLGNDRLAMSLRVKIAAAIAADPPFSELGAALALVELYQTAGRLSEPIGLLQQIHEALPDPLIRLSLCDLVFEDKDYERVYAADPGFEDVKQRLDAIATPSNMGVS